MPVDSANCPTGVLHTKSSILLLTETSQGFKTQTKLMLLYQCIHLLALLTTTSCQSQDERKLIEEQETGSNKDHGQGFLRFFTLLRQLGPEI